MTSEEEKLYQRTYYIAHRDTILPRKREDSRRWRERLGPEGVKAYYSAWRAKQRTKESSQ